MNTLPVAVISQPMMLIPPYGASDAGSRNTPEPIMLPMTSATAAAKPMSRVDVTARIVPYLQRRSGILLTALRLPNGSLLAMTRPIARRLMAAAAVVWLAGCGADSAPSPAPSPSPTPSPGSPTLESVVLNGLPQAPLIVGQAVQARAIGRFSNNTTQDLTTTATWASSSPNVVSVSAGGMTVARAAGDATLTATVSGISGSSAVAVTDAFGASTEFRVAVLLALASPPPPSDMMRVFDKANELLQLRTGARMTQIGVANPGPGVPSQLARTYLDSMPPVLPDGILALSEDATAIGFGGYSQTLAVAPPYANRYPTPFGDSRAYLAVMHFDHKYARCGYDMSGSTRISDRSGGGECRNQTGLLCVDTGRYWQCPDTLADLYSQPDHFPACTIVHEFMHPFGSAGNFDHYGTAQCTARTGMSSAAASDRSLFQQHCGMCPDVYLNFRPRPPMQLSGRPLSGR